MPVVVIIADPPLPAPRGPLSAALIAYLGGASPTLPCRPVRSIDAIADDDLQLALYCCYELHYRGFLGVPDEYEWDPALLGLRGGLERTFLTALRADVEPGTDVDAEVAGLLVEPPSGTDGTGVSHHLLRE